ncbi:MAG TPA: FHA domain-containing protein, partial [Gemmatimonadaceae bacterium]|nr:FHA domain-containing protein [Gemmatimonadaceae bacterium]
FVIDLAADAARVGVVHPDSVVTLNGSQLHGEPCPLAHGDVIHAGRAVFVYLERDDADAAARGRPPGPEAGEAWLIDRQAGLGYALAADQVGIGRDPSNAVALRAPTVSRFHATIRREAGGLVLHPAGSSGTRLNGARVGTPSMLAEGDEIEIAGTVLRVQRGPLPEDIRPAPAAAPGTGPRRPTVQRMTPLSAEATRFSGRPTLGKLLVLLVLLAALFFWFFPRHG